MSIPFASLEARANRSAIARLANAEAVFATATVSVVFAAGGQELNLPAGVPRLAAEWRISAPAEDFAAASIELGAEVTLRDTEYRVTAIDTDPTGWMTLTLRPAG